MVSRFFSSSCRSPPPKFRCAVLRVPGESLSGLCWWEVAAPWFYAYWHTVDQVARAMAFEGFKATCCPVSEKWHQFFHPCTEEIQNQLHGQVLRSWELHGTAAAYDIMSHQKCATLTSLAHSCLGGPWACEAEIVVCSAAVGLHVLGPLGSSGMI